MRVARPNKPCRDEPTPIRGSTAPGRGKVPAGRPQRPARPGAAGTGRPEDAAARNTSVQHQQGPAQRDRRPEQARLAADRRLRRQRGSHRQQSRRHEVRPNEVHQRRRGQEARQLRRQEVAVRQLTEADAPGGIEVAPSSSDRRRLPPRCQVYSQARASSTSGAARSAQWWRREGAVSRDDRCSTRARGGVTSVVMGLASGRVGRPSGRPEPVGDHGAEARGCPGREERQEWHQRHAVAGLGVGQEATSTWLRRSDQTNSRRAKRPVAGPPGWPGHRGAPAGRATRPPASP